MKFQIISRKIPGLRLHFLRERRMHMRFNMENINSKQSAWKFIFWNIILHLWLSGSRVQTSTTVVCRTLQAFWVHCTVTDVTVQWRMWLSGNSLVPRYVCCMTVRKKTAPAVGSLFSLRQLWWRSQRKVVSVWSSLLLTFQFYNLWRE